ncbi:glycoside hydrolase family 30 beta sandwich domain-containing protein [Granulicella sp. S190]|uniref:glycoside hydrolase family 30 beta sandwich domain-containing protein n=1 Tax=Granulicella sp. S190 TaxID=1747226 RepID=UPI00131D1D00|nr:glycoside hydrolase family 30 beta sandwich domain-containing protein [Granulicella sp. S190]
MTECSGGTWQKESPLAVTTHLLIDSIRNWAEAVSLWGVILDSDHNPHAGGCGTCRGLVTVNFKEQPPTITYTGDFYALAQASKFVHLGAVHIHFSSLGRQSLESVAFQNTDDSIVLLVFNNRSDTTDFAVTWNGKSFYMPLPAQSLATYIWPRGHEPKA